MSNDENDLLLDFKQLDADEKQFIRDLTKDFALGHQKSHHLRLAFSRSDSVRDAEALNSASCSL